MNENIEGHISKATMDAIGDAIREKRNEEALYLPSEMPAAIAAIPNSYAASDEGKVVKNGALVAQTAMATEITANGTYDTTENNSVTVNVSGGGGIPGVYTGILAPTSDVGDDGDIYIRKYALPNNINFVEYLENNGTQYIDSGVTGNQGTRVFCKFKMNGGNGVLAGRNSATSQTICITGTSNTTFSLDFGTNRTSIAATINSVYEVDTGNLFKTNNGTIVGTNVSSSFTTPVTIKLFAIHATNSYGLGISPQATIYRATFIQDGIVVKDFLPALDGNGIACMYEAISGNYHYNIGSGDFSYGNNYAPRAAQTLYRKVGGAWKIINQTGAIV